MRFVVKGALWYTLGSGMYSASTFIFLILVSRYCGEGTAGDFSIAFTTAQMLYIVDLFGANMYHMTDYSGEYDFLSYLRLRCITSLAAVFITACLSAAEATPEKAALLFALSLYMFVSAAADLWQSEFFRLNRLDLSGQSLFFRNFFSVIFFFLGIVVFHNALFASLCVLISNLVFSTLFGPCRIRREKIAYITQARKSRGLLTACTPLFISGFLTTLLPNLSKYIMDWLETNEVVGRYSMIFMPVQLVNLLSSFIFHPYIKRYSDALAAKDKNGFLKLLRVNTLQIASVTAFSSLLACTLGIPVLSWLYKAKLSPYRLELIGAVFSGGLLAYSTLGYFLIVTMRMQRVLCLLYAATALICAAVSIPLIGSLSMLGGIISCAISYLFLCITETILILRHLKNNEGSIRV